MQGLSASSESEIPVGFSGDYPSWDAAFSRCTDYDPGFEDRVRLMTLAVLRGHAEHTRDGVLYQQIEYSWPLLAGLMYCAALARGRLDVLDFGGSLGATYLQNRRFLDRLPTVSWHIVERAGNVAFARENIRHERLHFYATVDECLESAKPDVLLMSCVLQSLPAPYDFLHSMVALPFKHILIDRLPINGEPRDRLTIFRVWPDIVANQSRPWWFFHEERILDILRERFDIVEKFAGFESANVPSRYIGLVCTRRDEAAPTP
jgi:putative methyltransferase (TIGR04325 family)